METWMHTSLMLCIFGLLKEFRPAEPFITPYLINYKNFTEKQVTQDIYPIQMYSWLGLLIVVFLVTDILRYKPVIVLMELTMISTFSLYRWGTTLWEMQIMEVLYGLGLASEVAYFTYIYAQVDKEKYQIVTSHTRSSFLVGRFLCGIISQSLISTGSANYNDLFYITIMSLASATLWALLLLPPVKHSIYFHRQKYLLLNRRNVNTYDNPDDTNSVECLSEVDENVALNVETRLGETDRASRNSLTTNCVTAYKYLWLDFKKAFTNTYVLKWSLWWALATCGYLQGITYIQVLWKTIEKDIYGEDGNAYIPWNGAVEAASTIIGAGAAFACGWLDLNWKIWGELVLAVCSAIQGICLLVGAFSSTLWLAYIIFVVFAVLYHPMITVANSEVAKNISEDSFALVFGVNTFLTLILQSILTILVISNSGFALDTRDQFKVYGICYLVVAAVFMVLALYYTGRYIFCYSRQNIANDDNNANRSHE